MRVKIDIDPGMVEALKSIQEELRQELMEAFAVPPRFWHQANLAPSWDSINPGGLVIDAQAVIVEDTPLLTAGEQKSEIE